MQLSPIMSLIGAILIVGAIILHIVCLSTPNMAGADSNETKMKQKIEELLKKKRAEGWSATQIDDLERKVLDGGVLTSSNIKYGLWKMCLHGQVSGMSFDFCAKWASETKSDSTTGMTESFKAPAWIRGAQAMSIIGLLVAVAAGALSAIYLCVPSRGDRLRLLPAFICISAFVGGVIILIGDIIVAAKYEKIMTSMAEDGTEMPDPELLNILESLFYLSWGFALDVVSAALLLLSGLFHIVAGRVAQEGGMV